MDEFNRSLGKILVSEGGFTNNLKNPGGATNRGVTQRVYNEDRMSRGLSAQSVQLITDVEIADIYRKRYWNEARGDSAHSRPPVSIRPRSTGSSVKARCSWTTATSRNQ
jgi:lysozyme family protein